MVTVQQKSLKCSLFSNSHLHYSLSISWFADQGLNIYTFFSVESELMDLLSEPEKYADFQKLGDASEMFKVGNIFGGFFTGLKKSATFFVLCIL